MILCNIGLINFLGHDCGTILRRCHTHLLNKRLLLDIFHIGHGISPRDSDLKPDSEARGLIWVEGWYQGWYGRFHVIICLSHILHWLFPSIDFYIADKIFELTNCENKSLKELPLFNLKILFFESGFKNISNNVDLCNDVRKCLQNLPKTLTFEWKFLFNASYTFEPIIPFRGI